MSEISQEAWTAYCLDAKFSTIPVLYPIRDTILDHAQLAEGFLVLDVGCGDGLIGFGALERVGPAGKVIFSDIAQGLVDHCRSLAAEKGVLERCAFLRASVDDLSALPADSVDAVTARSVLCHVPPPGKAPALREFHRVLKPGRRLSMFDPINRFPALHPEPPHLLWGYDISAVQPLADKVRAFFRRAQPIAEHPSLHFDERDLFELAVAAGFRDVDLAYAAWQHAPPPGQPQAWEALLHAARNHGARKLSLADALQGALTPAEAARFTAHLRPLVEAGQTVPQPRRFAQAYLWASK